MSTSIFDEKAAFPNNEALASALGATHSLWNHLFGFVQEENHASGEWKFYSKKAGWAFVLKSGKRTLFYMIPQNEYFMVTFVFGEKAVHAAKVSQLPERILRSIEEATPYVEGRSFMVDVRNPTDVEIIKQLLLIKESN